LKIRILTLTVLGVVFASVSFADLMGSTYNFTTSVTGNVQISPLGATGSHTDPANPGFCVGPPVACSTGSGVSGGFTFTEVNPTLSHINFSFFGSTGSATGSFSIDLGSLVLPDHDQITGVSLASGSLGGASIGQTWNGTDAVFTFSTGSGYSAIGGNFVTFNVAEVATPEPSSILLLITVAGGLLIKAKKLRRV
jgi:hypothetical protein